jgi:hypothetical protein
MSAKLIKYDPGIGVFLVEADMAPYVTMAYVRIVGVWPPDYTASWEVIAAAKSLGLPLPPLDPSEIVVSHFGIGPVAHVELANGRKWEDDSSEAWEMAWCTRYAHRLTETSAVAAPAVPFPDDHDEAVRAMSVGDVRNNVESRTAGEVMRGVTDFLLGRGWLIKSSGDGVTAYSGNPCGRDESYATRLPCRKCGAPAMFSGVATTARIGNVTDSFACTSPKCGFVDNFTRSWCPACDTPLESVYSPRKGTHQGCPRCEAWEVEL